MFPEPLFQRLFFFHRHNKKAAKIWPHRGGTR